MPRCKGCGFEINPRDDECGYFTEADGSVWCEKCYANKRYKEIKDKSKWFESTKAVLEDLKLTVIEDSEKIADETERKRIKKLIRTWLRKIPSKWEYLIKDKAYREKVRKKWDEFGWKPME